MSSREPRIIWRHDVEPPPEPTFRPAEIRLNTAWRQLVLIHSSFRATEQKEYRGLIESLRYIERMFFDHPDLAAYYDEWASTPSQAGDVSRARPTARVRHVVAIQAQFMEDVYYVLQLDRFANALDNRGWMNLFRAWGRSPTFNAVFDGLRLTFQGEFEEFYDNYIRDYPGPIEEYPVPHPWDSEDAHKDPRDAAKRAAERGERRIFLPGVFLDSGVQEVGRHGERRRPRGASPGTGSRGVPVADPGNIAQKEQSSADQGPQGKIPPNA